MIYRHHIFTISCIFPVGHFLSEVQRWTDLPSGEVLGLLKGSAPVSRGAGTGALDVSRRAGFLGVTPDSVRGRPARQVIDDLLSKDGVGAPLQDTLTKSVTASHGIRPQRQVRARDARNARQRHLRGG